MCCQRHCLAVTAQSTKHVMGCQEMLANVYCVQSVSLSLMQLCAMLNSQTHSQCCAKRYLFLVYLKQGLYMCCKLPTQCTCINAFTIWYLINMFDESRALTWVITVVCCIQFATFKAESVSAHVGMGAVCRPSWACRSLPCY